MNRPLHSATFVALQLGLFFLTGCSAGVLSYEAIEPNFGSTFSIAPWAPQGMTVSMDVWKNEKTYLYRQPMEHLRRSRATLHEIQSGLYAGKLLYVGGKNSSGEWIASAVIMDSVTHEVIVELEYDTGMAMADPQAIEITSGLYSGHIILASSVGAGSHEGKGLVLDLSARPPVVLVSPLVYDERMSPGSMRFLKPSSYHSLGDSLIGAYTDAGRTYVQQYSLSNLLELTSGSWTDAGSVNVTRVDPRFLDFSETSVGTAAPLVMVPSGKAGDSEPQKLFTFASSNGWSETTMQDSTGVLCAGTGANFLAPHAGMGQGKLIRIAGVSTGAEGLGGVPTDEECRHSIEVIRFTPASGTTWVATTLALESTVLPFSNGMSGDTRAVEIRAGRWAGDFVISAGRVNDIWDGDLSDAEQLRRVRLNADWTISYSFAFLQQENGTAISEMAVDRKNSELIALKDGRVALTGGECLNLGNPTNVTCLAKIAIHSPYAPIKIDGTSTPDARLDFLEEGVDGAFSVGFANNSQRWIVFPTGKIPLMAIMGFDVQAVSNATGQKSNILRYVIRDWPL